MSPALPPTPWGSNPARRAEALRRRASTLMWGLGGVLVVWFGCCSLGTATLGAMSVAEFKKLLPPGKPMPPVAEVHGWLIPIAVAMLTLGFLPGLAYIALGFPVRAGLRGPTRATLVLVIIQGTLLALCTLPVVLASIATADPGALGLSVVGGGGMLTAQGMLALTLLQLLRGPGIDEDLDSDPWNEPEA